MIPPRSGLSIAVVLMLVMACGGSPAVTDLVVELELNRLPPPVGREVVAEVRVRRKNGSPVTGADLALEGHMTHPGMAPVIAPLADVGDGRYRTAMTLTMGGEWVVFLSGRLADGVAVRQRLAGFDATSTE